MDTTEYDPDEALSLDAGVGWKRFGRITLDIEDALENLAPSARLRLLHLLGRSIEERTIVAATAARDIGASWAEVGELLGVTKQAAQQRFGA